jgi:DNA-binding Xre family transcriptional regulator
VIKFRLQKLLAGRSLYWLSKETGIRWGTLAKMEGDKAQRIELQALENICEALECEPGELIVRIACKPKHRRRVKSV